MTEVAKEVMGQFPIDDLCFILTAGLFAVLAFPFDIFSFNFISLATFNWADLPSLVSSNFKPFVNLTYLGQFQDRFYILLLASLPFGVMIYFSSSIYEKLNSLLSRLFKRFLRETPREKFGTAKLKEDIVMEEKFRNASIARKLRFYRWLKDRGVNKYIVFIWSMRQVATALLFGIETLLFVYVLPSSILVLISTPSSWVTCLTWSVISLLLLLFFARFAYFDFEKRYNKTHGELFATFVEEERFNAQEWDFKYSS
jgi:hypothetical protein